MAVNRMPIYLIYKTFLYTLNRPYLSFMVWHTFPKATKQMLEWIPSKDQFLFLSTLFL